MGGTNNVNNLGVGLAFSNGVQNIPGVEDQIKGDELQAQQNYMRGQALNILNDEMVRSNATFGFGQRPEPKGPYNQPPGQPPNPNANKPGFAPIVNPQGNQGNPLPPNTVPGMPPNAQ